MSAISVQNVHKSFYTYSSEWARFAAWFGAPPKLKSQTDILKGIDFSIAPGEAVGLVGQNGAGKSTLLKIITGTMQPTKGSVTVNGRIAALLELGMGFNPDMTGRQNVYNSAGLMGFTQDDIDGLIKSIEDFAEIGAYFDQPIRVYSSGMQVRLAFAVATAVRPEILIVDEALSVGDAYFQHKSFSRIREFREAGTTLLLVSHDRSSIIAICDRAILLDDGHVRKDGAPEEVLDLYNALIAEKEGHLLEQITDASGRVQTRSGSGEATLETVRLLDETGKPTELVRVGSRVTLEIVAKVNTDIDQLVAGYMIKDRLGQAVFGTNTHQLGQVQQGLKAGDIVRFRFAFDANIGYGNFSIAAALHGHETHVEQNYEWRDLAVTFSVVNADHPEFVGMAWVPPVLEVER
ncbi:MULTISPECIES: ABC transporter ATP-binding protein [Devosia]|uniref:Teichoic acids export ATP-binding protein TagH n=1 Tax=Devosia equisanguinis TaxID=2490941 RepID=A0A3S4CAW7_9HYPH|nr:MULTISPECIES: ABC transporter ATP-binding protein [Devosia]ODT47475.1 MAG: sugar ABC transporter ATP-binding protein [Pelagibacterium sp. SCN 63-126]ODU86104.1 MAG: sugar ABC transporter ATP-binding protein [Pelagibacterium sp. SCN 63-17]OJX42817.1 MAG: sugar ABC transporter ATP-binding protein [Devosia sp. 63-57]VDS03998.1 Teichoic acids export ATP-binding protein TagH [Devosia equisanguinis]